MQIWTFSKHPIFKYDFWEKTRYSNMNFWCFLVTPASKWRLPHIPPKTEILEQRNHHYLELLLSLWYWLWLLVEVAGGFNDEANWTGVGQSRPEGIPSFGIFKFLVFPVYFPNLCSIHKGRNGICITKYSCKAKNDLLSCNPNLRTQGMEGSKSTTQDQSRHLALCVMLLLLLKTQPKGQE